MIIKEFTNKQRMFWGILMKLCLKALSFFETLPKSTKFPSKHFGAKITTNGIFHKYVNDLIINLEYADQKLKVKVTNSLSLRMQM